MRIRRVSQEEMAQIWPALEAGRDRWLTVCLFGGDRWVAADLGGVALEEDGRIIALASLSSEGEMGEGPSIIGVFTVPSERKKGHGLTIFKEAKKALGELFPGSPICCSAVTPEGESLVRRGEID